MLLSGLPVTLLGKTYSFSLGKAANSAARSWLIGTRRIEERVLGVQLPWGRNSTHSSSRSTRSQVRLNAAGEYTVHYSDTSHGASNVRLLRVIVERDPKEAEKRLSGSGFPMFSVSVDVALPPAKQNSEKRKREKNNRIIWD